MNILMVDDNELHLKMGKVLLENLGHNVILCQSLPDLKQNLDKMGKIDIAFIDYRLEPGVTGIDVLEFMKSKKLAGTRYIAITADISEKNLLERSGFDSVAFKPVTEGMLKGLISKYE
jgi:CheY-like chemotaxis protein